MPPLRLGKKKRVTGQKLRDQVLKKAMEDTAVLMEQVKVDQAEAAKVEEVCSVEETELLLSRGCCAFPCCAAESDKCCWTFST